MKVIGKFVFEVNGKLLVSESEDLIKEYLKNKEWFRLEFNDGYVVVQEYSYSDLSFGYIKKINEVVS